MTQEDPPALPLAALAARRGEEIGVSPWLEVAQDRIDAFAAATGDRQFIHLDPVRAAAETPFGGTVAHGFLTLSLLSILAYAALPRAAGTRVSVNYGFDRVRFVAPVRAGARIRGRFRLAALDRPAADEIAYLWEVTVEIEGEARPALAALWRTRAWGDYGAPAARRDAAEEDTP
jgi:acyl dehydratase